MLLVKLLEIGMITPPMGMNVFVIKGVVGKLATLSQVFRGVFWFVVIDLVIVPAMVAFPNLVLFLPNLVN